MHTERSHSTRTADTGIARAQTRTRPAAGRIDNYPTRDRAHASSAAGTTWIERTVPAVWSDRSDRVPEGYADRGFAVTEGLLSPAQVQDHWQDLQQMMTDPAFAGDARLVREARSGAVRSVFEVHRISTMVDALIRSPEVLGTAEAILGSEVYVHQSRVNYMPGFRGTGFYWHSDFETWHAEDGLPHPRAVSLSIALTDNYPFNGGLMLMPGSHRYFVPCPGATPEDHHRSSLVRQEVGVPAEDDVTAMAAEFGIEQFTGQAGAALWFDANTLHGSGNNITPYPRSNIFVVFNSVDNAPDRPFAATRSRPAYIAARDTAALRG